MKVIKDNIVWDISDKRQQKVFLNAGWEILNGDTENKKAEPITPDAEVQGIDFDAMADDELMEYASNNKLDISKAKSREQLLKLVKEVKNVQK